MVCTGVTCLRLHFRPRKKFYSGPPTSPEGLRRKRCRTFALTLVINKLEIRDKVVIEIIGDDPDCVLSIHRVT